MRFRAGVVGAAVFVMSPVPLGAWGFDVHRLIMARVIDALPAGLSAFLAAERSFVIEHAVDPDLWRVVDLEGRLGPEGPNHYLNLDSLDEPRPFAGVPRDRQAFLTKYGSRRAEEAGRLPWRAAEIHAALVRAFRDAGPMAPRFRATNARYLAAVLAHYVGDAFVPFHATSNHDGQITNQTGIHARFETDLALRHRASVDVVRVVDAPRQPIVSRVFDALRDSEALVGTVLAADRAAAGPSRRYDAAYDAAFSRDAGPIAVRRMTDAVRGIAEAVLSAWIEAGRPALSGS
jgi:hypothetical protein